MNVERKLLSKVILDRDILSLIDAKVQPEFFQNTQYGQLFSWLLEYFQRYGCTPTVKVIRSNHPWFEDQIITAPEPMAWYIDQLTAAREYAILHDAGAEFGIHMKHGETDKARSIMEAALGQLAQELSPLRDANLTDPEYLRQWAADYRELAKMDGALRGLPTGFPVMDQATGGLRPEQLIVLVGPPKAGKSTGLLLMHKAVHDIGRIPLFIGFEMSNEEQRTRYAAIRANVDFHRLDRGILRPEEEQRFFRTLREMEGTPDMWLSADPSSTSTVAGIVAKIEQYKPAVVFVDGVYMMIDQQTGEMGTPLALTHITRGLKGVAQRYKIPIVISTQVLEWKMSKKKGITTQSIGYASSFAQDADVVFGLESTDDEDVKKLKVVAARNMKNRIVMLQWSWDTGIFEEMDEPDYEEDDHSISA